MRPHAVFEVKAIMFASLSLVACLCCADGKIRDAQTASEVTVKITRTFLNSSEISPLQYGQFMEYLCDLFPSMWAEKLYDGSFEGLSPYKVAFLKQTDFRENPWYPSGATNRAEYALDPKNPVSGKVSQRIMAGPGPPCTVGISQDGIAIQRGKACIFSCYFRQTSFDGPVIVRLHREGQVYATANSSQTGNGRSIAHDWCLAKPITMRRS